MTSSKISEDAFKGLLMHAYSNGLAAERMEALKQFSHSDTATYDPALIKAVEDFEKDFYRIVTSDFQAVLISVADNAGEYFVSAISIGLKISSLGWGYFGTGLAILVDGFHYLYGRDDMVRTLAMDITLQEKLRIYLNSSPSGITLRQKLLLNNMNHYLAYHFYADQLGRIDLLDYIFNPFNWGTIDEYKEYLKTEKKERYDIYRKYIPPDFLARDESTWILEKLATPAIHAVTPASPLSIIKPDPVNFVVSASDDDGIVRVDFRSGNYFLGMDTNGDDGWGFTWNTILYPGGQHLVEVIAIDNHGLSSVETVMIDLVDTGYTADLSATNLQASNTNPQVGQQVTFTANVKNCGVHTETNVPVTLYIDESPVSSQNVTLNPAEMTTLSYNWTATFGAHNVRVEAEAPYDQNPGNDFDTLILGSVEPGSLKIAGSSAPSAISANLVPGTSADYYVVLRNDGDIILNVSVSRSSPNYTTITYLDTTPFMINGKSFSHFHFRLSLSGSAPVNQTYTGSITFTSTGGNVVQALKVTGVAVASVVETSVAMDNGWVEKKYNWYYDTVDLTPWAPLIANGLDYARLYFTADAIDNCDGGYCNFLVSVLDGYWSYCGSGNGSFLTTSIPTELNWTFCGQNIIGHNTREIYVEALGVDRFHISNVEFRFKAYGGDPNLVLTRNIVPGTIYINQTATVNLKFTNTGTNIANEPLYNEDPLPYNLELVSGELTGDSSDVDPGETETASYVVRALQPGEYTFDSTSVIYYNPPSTKAFRSSFGNSVLTVLGGTLQPTLSFSSGLHYYGQPVKIIANVTDSLSGQSVSSAYVVATVTAPDNQTYDVLLRYSAALDRYEGDFLATYLLGSYTVTAQASADYYTSGVSSGGAGFTVVTPFGLDLTTSQGLTWSTPTQTSLLHFNLHNVGATSDTFDLDLSSLPADWKWGITPGIVTLAAGQDVDGAVVVAPHYDDLDGNYTVILRGTSLGDANEQDTQEFNISLDKTPPIVQALNIPDPVVTPGDPVILVVDYSEPVSLTMDLSEMDESFDPANVIITETDPVNHVYTLTYILANPLLAGDGVYRAALTAEDRAGNQTLTISEDISLERDDPKIIKTNAPSGEVIPFGSQVSLYFSEPMNRVATAEAITITPAITGTLVWANDHILDFVPTTYFEPETTYTLHVLPGGQDMFGNQLGAATWDFSISSIEQTVEVTVGSGWSLIGLPFESGSDFTFTTAEALCDKLEAQGGIPAEIASWVAGGWVSHLCNLPFNDFTLELGSGYFVRSAQEAQMDITGFPVDYGVDVELSPGWNLVGMPYGMSYTAESAGQEIISQGGTCTEIDRWYASGWDAHIIGLPFNDFSLEAGQGYFVRCSTASTWTMLP